MKEHGAYVDKNLIEAYSFYSLSLRLLNKSSSDQSLTEAEILDSINTLKSKMTPEQIQAGEREIANVMREYGVTL
jgi:hypothetical protein